MAIDHNVLIFERVREELRSGKTPRIALENGYAKAFSTIFDSTSTTILAALPLIQFGTGPIKGFAVTLCIGLAASMFTALFVTRAIFDYFLQVKRIKRLSV
jgi:preprotein translocase subunit SecD